jgi:predicted O-methyltransferase YrrM
MEKKIGKSIARQFYSKFGEAQAMDVYIVDLLQRMSREHSLNDPRRVFMFLRQCLAHTRLDVVTLKAGSNNGLRAQRFARFMEAVDGGLPPLPESVALRCASIADVYLASSEEVPRRGADVAWHFARSSIGMVKARVLSAAIRFMRPGRCLEIGTAYGLSAAVMAFALQRVAPEGRLLTIEIGEIQHRCAAALLGGLFGDRVECRKGNSKEILAPAASETAPLDFVFHDGGHSGENYVRDFSNVVDVLSPGAVVVFDDIRWRDALDPQADDPRCYAGWREVVDHVRVESAVEIGPALGLVMVS